MKTDDQSEPDIVSEREGLKAAINAMFEVRPQGDAPFDRPIARTIIQSIIDELDTVQPLLEKAHSQYVSVVKQRDMALQALQAVNKVYTIPCSYERFGLCQQEVRGPTPEEITLVREAIAEIARQIEKE